MFRRQDTTLDRFILEVIYSSEIPLPIPAVDIKLVVKYPSNTLEIERAVIWEVKSQIHARYRFPAGVALREVFPALEQQVGYRGPMYKRVVKI